MAALDFPASPTNGQVYQNWIYSTAKGAWQAKPMVSAKTVTSDVAPGNPANGDEWLNTLDGCLYIYYVDVDGGQWVQVKNDASFSSELGPTVDALNAGANVNYIINGAFEINQRGFTSTTSSAVYGFDRWKFWTSGGTGTYSAQAFTLGAAPVAGYEAKNFARIVTTGQSGVSDETSLYQPIEGVRTLAGETATISFWAKAGSGTPKIAVELSQAFGSGGSPSATVRTYAGQATLSTSWARYSVTATIPGISGKTLGTAGDDVLTVNLFVSAGSNLNSRTGSLGIQNNTFDIWGVQVQAGSKATSFHRASPTIAAELAACQRYYWRMTGDNAYAQFAQGAFLNTTTAHLSVQHPVQMRTSPHTFEWTTSTVLRDYTTDFVVTGAGFDYSSSTVGAVYMTIASGGTLYRPCFARANGTTAAFFGFSAEL